MKLVPSMICMVSFAILSTVTVVAVAEDSGFHREWRASRLDSLKSNSIGSCSLRETSAIESIRNLCDIAVAHNPSCRDVSPDKLRRCSDLEESSWAGRAFDRISGCYQGAGLAALDTLKALNELVVWYAMYFFDGGQTQRKFSQGTQSELAMAGDYLSAEYARGYAQADQTDSSAKREVMALGWAASSVAQDAWERVQEFVTKEVGVVGCLNHEEQNKVLCRFFIEVTVPPTGLVAILRNGARAASQSSQVSNAIRRAREASTVDQRNLAGAQLCEGCPVLRLAEESRAHIGRHIARPEESARLLNLLENPGALNAQNQIEVARAALTMARNYVDTSVFPGDMNPDLLFKTINSKVEGWEEIPAKQPGRRVMHGTIDVPGTEPRRYRVSVSFCVELECSDAAGRRFGQGEIISVEPRCGPGVMKIRKAPEIQGFLDGKNGFKRAAPILSPCQ